MNKTITDSGRTCAACDAFKPWGAFTKFKAGPHGHLAWCKVCRKLRERQIREDAVPLTHAALVDKLDYDPDTGVLTWRSTDRPAGCTQPNGYVRIRLLGRYYFAHRLAWLFLHKRWPVGDVDHINRVRDDNRAANLRECTRSQNQQNSTYTTGKLRGVHMVQNVSGPRWRAAVTVNRKLVHLGTFKSFFEAACARKAAELKHYSHAPK